MKKAEEEAISVNGRTGLGCALPSERLGELSEDSMFKRRLLVLVCLISCLGKAEDVFAHCLVFG